MGAGPRSGSDHQTQGCGIDEDETESVSDVVGPALERASALADQLARLLVPASLFS